MSSLLLNADSNTSIESLQTQFYCLITDIITILILRFNPIRIRMYRKTLVITLSYVYLMSLILKIKKLRDTGTVNLNTNEFNYA